MITNAAGEVLLLEATYGNLSWGLPGGALELTPVQRRRVEECLRLDGVVCRARF